MEKSKKFNSNKEQFEYVVKESEKYGYDFTVGDMQALLSEHDNGLSDDDLLGVVGGRSIFKDSCIACRGVVDRKPDFSFTKEQLNDFRKWFK